MGEGGRGTSERSTIRTSGGGALSCIRPVSDRQNIALDSLAENLSAAEVRSSRTWRSFASLTSRHMVGGLWLPGGSSIWNVFPMGSAFWKYRRANVSFTITTSRVGGLARRTSVPRGSRVPSHGSSCRRLRRVHVAVLHRAARDDAPFQSLPSSGTINASAGGERPDLLEARDDGGEGLRPRLGRTAVRLMSTATTRVRSKPRSTRRGFSRCARRAARRHEHHREGNLHDHQPAPQRERLVSFGRRSAAGCMAFARSRRVP